MYSKPFQAKEIDLLFFLSPKIQNIIKTCEVSPNNSFLLEECLAKQKRACKYYSILNAFLDYIVVACTPIKFNTAENVGFSVIICNYLHFNNFVEPFATL